MAENKLSEMIKTSLESIRNMLDANTIVGEPMTVPGGTTLIPVSKIAVGYASGGIDYVGKNAEKNPNSNFGGGGGTGVSVTPVAFIVVKENGECSMLNINAPMGAEDKVSQIISAIERSPELIEKFKEVFKKKEKSE